jgi:hypothetical protein
VGRSVRDFLRFVCFIVKRVTIFEPDFLLMNSLGILVFVAIKQTAFSDSATLSRDRILRLCRRNLYPALAASMPDTWKSIRSARKNTGRIFALDIRRPQLKAAQAVRADEAFSQSTNSRLH